MALTQRKAGNVIAETLRTRICLHAGDDLMVLHEGKIAEEFGVSRTPIRQILQKLAHDKLVETRPGIGTVAAPLDDGMFERDLKTARSMVLACAAVAQHPTPRDTQFSLIALSSMSMDYVGGIETKGAFVDVATRFLDTLVPIVTDPLVANAYTASFMRIIRWRLFMFDKDPTFTWERMIELIEAAANAANSPEPGAIFLAMAEKAKFKKFAHGLSAMTQEPAQKSNVQNIR